MNYEYYAIIFLAGSFGSLIRVIVDSGHIVFPKRVDGGLALGFIGSILVGGFVGCVVDGQPLTAAMGGFIGADLLDRFVPNFNTPKVCEEVEKKTLL